MDPGSVERACAAQYQQWWYQTHGQNCGSCNSGWPAVAECLVRTAVPQTSEAVLNTCLHQVNDQDWNLPMAHDRPSDVLACVQRK